MSRIGTGGVKAYTRLGPDPFFPGGMVPGEVHITGGDAQELNRSYICVVTPCKHDASTHEYTLTSHDISGCLRLETNENYSIPFTSNPPRYTPLSLCCTCVYVKTGLDVPTPSTRATGTSYKSPPALSSRLFSTPLRTSASGPLMAAMWGVSRS